MKPKNKIIILLPIILLVCAAFLIFAKQAENEDALFISYTVNPKKQTLKLYWKNEKQENFRSIQNLKLWLSQKQKNLVFAMNAGIYKFDNSPQGLFIQEKITKNALDTTTASGNFYLKPNGVFYLTTANEPVICETKKFNTNPKINYATQSGPMLVIDGAIHPDFNENSTNLNIRNGVGILPNNSILFAMSKKEINFYNFAKYFKDKGCKNALYLDGFVSQIYLPEKNWVQTGGNFGVIFGVTN
jgi:uncharacterized protein YigE (DUF2233 family)